MIKAIAQSETIKNYAGAIAILLGALPAVGSLALSIVSTFRGEPYAERTWSTLKKTVDEQSVSINSINSKLSKMESLEEGIRIGKLQAELETLHKTLQRRIAKSLVSSKKCPKGQTLIDDQCQSTSVLSEEKTKIEATQKLIEQVKQAQKKSSPIKLQKLPLIPDGEEK